MHWRQDTFGTTRFGSVRFGLVWYSLCVLIVLVTATLTTSLRFAHFKHNANFEVHVLHISLPPSSVASLYNLNPLLADLLRLFPSPSLSLSLWSFLHARAVSSALAYMLIVARNPVYCVHIKLLVLVSGLVFKLNVIHFG